MLENIKKTDWVTPTRRAPMDAAEYKHLGDRAIYGQEANPASRLHD